MSNFKREFKGVWMPAVVYLNRDVSWNAKAIWMEIDSLQNNDKDCFFSNEYLSRFLNCSIAQVGRYITELKQVGWIEDAGFDGRKRYLRSTLDYSKMSRQTPQNGESSVLKNDLHNNSYNTLPNEVTEESDDSSQKALFPEEGSKESVNQNLKEKKRREAKPVDPEYPEFVNIWTEAYPELGFDGLSGKKIKSLISQTKAILRENDKSDDSNASKNLFAYILAYMKRSGHWLHGKSITVVDSKYREIYFEIRNGKQQATPKKQSARDYINSFKQSR